MWVIKGKKDGISFETNEIVDVGLAQEKLTALRFSGADGYIFKLGVSNGRVKSL